MTQLLHPTPLKHPVSLLVGTRSQVTEFSLEISEDEKDPLILPRTGKKQGL